MIHIRLSIPGLIPVVLAPIGAQDHPSSGYILEPGVGQSAGLEVELVGVAGRTDVLKLLLVKARGGVNVLGLPPVNVQVGESLAVGVVAGLGQVPDGGGAAVEALPLGFKAGLDGVELVFEPEPVGADCPFEGLVAGSVGEGPGVEGGLVVGGVGLGGRVGRESVGVHGYVRFIGLDIRSPGRITQSRFALRNCRNISVPATRFSSTNPLPSCQLQLKSIHFIRSRPLLWSLTISSDVPRKRYSFSSRKKVSNLFRKSIVQSTQGRCTSLLMLKNLANRLFRLWGSASLLRCSSVFTFTCSLICRCWSRRRNPLILKPFWAQPVSSSFRRILWFFSSSKCSSVRCRPGFRSMTLGADRPKSTFSSTMPSSLTALTLQRKGRQQGEVRAREQNWSSLGPAFLQTDSWWKERTALWPAIWTAQMQVLSQFYFSMSIQVAPAADQQRPCPSRPLSMKLKNPTAHFFEQADSPQPLYRDKIQQLVSQLVDFERCKLCLQSYDLGLRMPRILIHCGHTCCSACLETFFRRGRVRCPFCLKLVRNLDGVQILPVNHTIFTRLVERHNRANPLERIAASTELIKLFDYSQKLREENKNIDKESGLPYCQTHSDRVEHFFCQSHKKLACRACCQASHAEPGCRVIELYEVADPQAYLMNQGFIDEEGYEVQQQQEGHPDKRQELDFLGLVQQSKPRKSL